MNPESSFQGTGPIAILGAGSLGRLWAGYLPSGRAVFLPRSSSSTPSASVVEFTLRQPNGTEIACAVPEQPVTEAHPELLLVTTKAGDTAKALEENLPSLPQDVPVILFQNGLGCQQAAARHWHNRPILAATTTEGANRPHNNVLVHAGHGQTWIGALNHEGERWAAEAARQLGESGLEVEPENNIRQRLWDKLVVNAGINAFTAILDCPNGEILEHSFFLDHIEALSEEIAGVMAVDAPEPMQAEDIRKRIYAVARSTAKNTSSMRADLHRGRKTEIDFINGYIAETGKAAGIETPVNQMLTRQVKELTE